MDAAIPDEMPDPRWRQSFRRKLLAWYAKNARDLPWRRTHDPYCIWVSEIMLQQTQVATVIPYYQRFLKSFPNVVSLANARERSVLRLWEGLGYYRRARQLHAAAKEIKRHHAGKFPSKFEDVLNLPGIGRYTAGAILSFAMDQPQPIVESNTIRLYSRLMGSREDPTKTAGQKRLWEFANDILPRRNPGQLNQALIELGATLCTPRSPECSVCPVRSLCAAFLDDCIDDIPTGKKKVAYVAITEAAVVVRSSRGILIRQCQPGERWAGLWDFPRVAVTKSRLVTRREEITSAVRDLTGQDISLGQEFFTLKHGVTRYRITLLCFDAAAAATKCGSKDQKWVSTSELLATPLSVTGRKIAAMIVA